MRLTQRMNDGCDTICENCPMKGKCSDSQDCVNVLAERLAAYEDAEEQGLLVRLPQKTVYAIRYGEGKNCDHICPAKIDGVGCCSLCDNGELIIYEEDCRQEHLSRIGTTVFLTRGAAEAALKGESQDV